MLPCQVDCNRYYEGCHKSCLRWKGILKANQIYAQRKKAYLAFYGQRCDDVVRRCYQTVPHPGHR